MRHKKRTIAAALSLLFISSTMAQAAYTVIDDDLMPTPMNEPQQQKLPQKVLQQNYQSFADDSYPNTAQGLYKEYLIPFFKKSSALTQDGIHALRNLLPSIGEGTIKIIGRQDATVSNKNGLDKLGVNRANKMRDYLTKQGVPASSIFIEVDNNPNPQANGNIYPSSIVLNALPHESQAETPSMMVNASIKEPVQTQTQRISPKKDVLLQPVKQTTTTITATPATTVTKSKLVGIIYQSAETGQLDQMLAVKLLRVLLENSSDPAYTQMPTAAQPQPAVYKNAPAPTQYRAQSPAPIQTPVISVQQSQTGPSKWTLKPEKTLKDNIELWAKSSNYTVKWNASNFYKVGKSSVITGEFLDVVDKVTVAAGVDMAVSNKTSTIFINDRQ